MCLMSESVEYLGGGVRFLLVSMVMCGVKGTKRRKCRKISGIAPFVNAETAGMFGFESLLLSNLSWLIKPNPTLGTCY